MKKITLLIAAMLAVNVSLGQFLENFNSAAFPPTGWAVYSGTNGLGTVEAWVSNGTAPDLFAFNRWEAVAPATASAEDWIVSPLIPISASLNELTFDAGDFNAGSFGSVLSVRVSTTSQTSIASFVEVENLTEAELGNNAGLVFTNFTVDLSTYVGQSVYIAFVHIQNDGDAVAVDNVSVSTPITSPPSCATLVSPAVGATGVAINTADQDMDGAPDNSITLTWTAPAGVPATTYEIRFGTNPTMPTSLTTTFTGTSARITGTLFNTLYYWQIIPANSAGSATGCPIWSFTSQVATGTPPTNATTPTPTNGATMVSINTADLDMNGTPDNAVDISWVQTPTGQQPNAYTIRLGQSATMLQTLTTTFTGTSARFVNQLPNTTYFWQAVPTNNGVEATNQPVWSYTTGALASVDDNAIEFFTLSPNPAVDFITINTDSQIEKISVYNLLGQVMMTNPTLDNNRLDVTGLQSGVYLITVSNGANQQTSRFIKN